jgi:hypothetical protein
MVLGWVTYEDYVVMKMLVTHSPKETIPLMAPREMVEKDFFCLASNLSFFSDY